MTTQPTATSGAVLEIFKACLKNGEEFRTIYENNANDAMKSNPMLKHLLDKTKEDMTAIDALATKIGSLRSGNLQSLKTELGDVINRLDAMSIENVAKIKEAVAASNTSKLRKKIAENDATLNKLSEDANVRSLAKVLLEQNKKIVECLKYAHSLLPKFFGTPATQGEGQARGKKKLFIIGDDLSRASYYGEQKLEPLGEVTIHCDGDVSKMTADGMAPDFPARLNGYLQTENGEKMEVVLKLREAHSYNLIDFTAEESKMSATISIQGEAEEKIEVVEINLTQQGPELLAVVQNESGDVDEVRVQLVPVSPESQVHGKILEIQKIGDDEENLEDIQMDLIEDSHMNSTMIRLPEQFATPMRKAQKTAGRHDPAVLYGTATRRSPRLERGLIDSVNDSIQMDRSVKEVQEVLAPAIDQIVENAAQKLVEQLADEMNLSDESAIQFANISEASNQSTGYGNVSNRSIQQRSMQRSFRSPVREQTPPRPPLVRQQLIVTSPGANIDDESAIDFADISNRSNRSMRLPTPARNRSLGANLVNISGQQFTDMRTPQQNITLRQPFSASPRRNSLPPPMSPAIREGILVNFTSPQNQTHLGTGNFEGDLINVGQRQLHFSPQPVRRQPAGGLNRTMPLRQNVAASSMNRSLQMKQGNVQVQRPFAPIQMIPSRIPEDAPSGTGLRQTQMTPNEQFRRNQQQQLNYSDLRSVQPPFSDSFEALESQASEATQVNRAVNDLRLQRTLEAQRPQDFAARFNTSSVLLDDMTFDDMDETDSSMNATIVQPPPLPVQSAAEFAARFNVDDDFLDDFELVDDNDVSLTSPRRIRVVDEPRAPARRPNTGIPLRYQKVTEPKLLDFDD